MDPRLIRYPHHRANRPVVRDAQPTRSGSKEVRLSLLRGKTLLPCHAEAFFLPPWRAVPCRAASAVHRSPALQARALTLAALAHQVEAAQQAQEREKGRS